ncbi:MAG: hypothetical protein ACRD3W_01075, partial [Terriglobales bacterium]
RTRSWVAGALLAAMIAPAAALGWGEKEFDAPVLHAPSAALQEVHEQAPVRSEQSLDPQAKPGMLKGGISKTFCVPQGTPLKLKIAMVPTNGMAGLDRDLDGNLLPAQVNQPITAKITEDLYVDNSKVIPEGTVFYGKVSEITPPRRFSRPGELKIQFDNFVTPDGRKFAFQTEADNFVKSTAKTKGVRAAKTAYSALGGAIVGAMVAYEVCGMHYTIAMHGYNIAGGAAAGAILAAGCAMMHKGHQAYLEPGDDLNMHFDKDLLLPAATAPTPKSKIDTIGGLDVHIKKSKLISDGLDGHLMRMDVTIVNNSRKRLKSIDLFLEDSNGNRCPLCAGPEEDSDFLFEVAPHSTQTSRLYFQIEFPKLKRTLVWINHTSRQIAYKGPSP